MKDKAPYAGYAAEGLILRDHLAIDRTILANERTFLAYIRTAMAFFIVGGTLLKFFDDLSADIGAYASFFVGTAFLVIGIRRYRMFQRIINSARKSADEQEGQE